MDFAIKFYTLEGRPIAGSDLASLAPGMSYYVQYGNGPWILQTAVAAKS